MAALFALESAKFKGAGPGAGGPARLYKFDGSNWTLRKSEDPLNGTNFGMGGVPVSGSGAITRIALGVTNSWGNWNGQQIAMKFVYSGWADDSRAASPQVTGCCALPGVALRATSSMLLTPETSASRACAGCPQRKALLFASSLPSP